MKRNILAVSAIIVLAFVGGGAAVEPLVHSIDPLSSGPVLVDGANAEITDVDWVIDPSSSTVEGVIVQIRNTHTQAGLSRFFDVVVQVSCQSSGAVHVFVDPGPDREPGTADDVFADFAEKHFICAGGSFTTPLLQPGETRRIAVDFDMAIAPERTQIEDLSFIIREQT